MVDVPRPNRVPYRSAAGEADQAQSDPLAELARLIGQSDPFAESDRAAWPDPRTRGRASSAPSSSSPPPSEPPVRQADLAEPEPRSSRWSGIPYTAPTVPQPDRRREPTYESRPRYVAPRAYEQSPTYQPLQQDDQAQAQPAYDQQVYENAYPEQAYDQGREQQAYVPPAHDLIHGLTHEHPNQAPGYDEPGYEQRPPAYTYQPPPDVEAGEPELHYYGDQPERSGGGRRSGWVTIIAVAAVAVLGTAGAYAYRTVFSGKSFGIPPVIKADTSPAKIVPAIQSADVGGKRIYDRLSDAGPNERVVPREEQPVDVNSAARPAYPGLAGTPAAPPTGLASEPKKIRTVTIRADQPPQFPGASPAAAAPAVAAPRPTVTSTQAIAAPAAAAPAAAAPARTGSNPLLLVPQDNELPPPSDGRQASPNVAAIAPRASAVAAGAAGGSFVVQLSAQKTQDEAAASFRANQVKYASVLGGRQPLIRKKDLGSKGVFYAAQVGPFTSRDDALGLCEQLKAAGGSCIVQKN